MEVLGYGLKECQVLIFLVLLFVCLHCDATAGDSLSFRKLSLRIQNCFLSCRTALVFQAQNPFLNPGCAFLPSSSRHRRLWTLVRSECQELRQSPSYKSAGSFTIKVMCFHLNRQPDPVLVPGSALSRNHQHRVLECSLFGLFTSSINKDQSKKMPVLGPTQAA